MRHDETDTILVLANLSNQVQPVELDLAAYEGLMPQEMFGGAEFPAIGATPYFLSLGPYASYWFLLHAPEPVIMWTEVTPDALEELTATLPVLVLSGRWDSLFAPEVRRRLETDLFPAYLLRQRWFGGKARTIERVRLRGLWCTASGGATNLPGAHRGDLYARWGRDLCAPPGHQYR